MIVSVFTSRFPCLNVDKVPSHDVLCAVCNYHESSFLQFVDFLKGSAFTSMLTSPTALLHVCSVTVTLWLSPETVLALLTLVLCVNMIRLCLIYFYSLKMIDPDMILFNVVVQECKMSKIVNFSTFSFFSRPLLFFLCVALQPHI